MYILYTLHKYVYYIFSSKICSLSIKERLTRSAVVTKFRRLCLECQGDMLTTVRGQCDRLDKDIEKKRLLLT